MRILSFRIENFRNLKFAECPEVPQFMVVCGGNGCGKSTLLEALMTAKEHAGSYGNFSFDPAAVSADATEAIISMRVQFAENERAFVKNTFAQECPEVDEIEIRITRGGGVHTRKRSNPVAKLLGYYSKAVGSPGFFDYITAYRQTAKTTLNSWDSAFLSDDRAKGTLAQGQQKFQFTKQFLAGLKMQDLQQIQTACREGHSVDIDSLAPIRRLFDRFFAPMRFQDVYLDRSPFAFVVKTPLGDIDIDDLSAGEKEILNIFIRFYQLNPHKAVILFDEADAHLHPDLERRYLGELRNLASENQVILTTHSPEMMIAAGSESLYTVLKYPSAKNPNQLVRVTSRVDLHDALSEIMGSRGLVSFNQRIVFIEGTEASADRDIYESLYPASQYNVSFVPVGNTAVSRATADRINSLLTAAVGFQQYFCIIDRDIERSERDPTEGKRLFRLPVYHVENFLLNDDLILKACRMLLGSTCPVSATDEVKALLERHVLGESHLKAYAKAILDAAVSSYARSAYEAVYKRASPADPKELPDYQKAEETARQTLQAAVANGTWRKIAKGRELLKSLCGELGIRYDHFRNALVSQIKTPPSELSAIMNKILNA